MILAALLLCAPVANDRQTFSFDVIERIEEGAVVQGSPEFSTERFGYTYHFTTRANLEQFLGNPARFEVQCGGACARMGVLSGLGTPKIHTVWSGQLYIFASEACRTGFLKAPERLLDKPDLAPEASAEQLAAGQALLARMIEGLGGEDAVDAIHAVRFTREDRNEETGELEFRQVRTARLPSEFIDAMLWPGHPEYVMGSSKTGAFDAAGDSVSGLHPLRRAAFVSAQRQHPLLLARARGLKGFLAVPAGTETLGDSHVDRLHIHFEGRSTFLGIDRESGRVRYLETRERGAGSVPGIRRYEYDGFQRISDVTVPTIERRSFNGEAQGSRTWSIEIDPELSAGHFER